MDETSDERLKLLQMLTDRLAYDEYDVDDAFKQDGKWYVVLIPLEDVTDEEI